MRKVYHGADEVERGEMVSGETIVLVTHNSQVSERAQRTVRMRDGRAEVAPGDRAEAIG